MRTIKGGEKEEEQLENSKANRKEGGEFLNFLCLIYPRLVTGNIKGSRQKRPHKSFLPLVQSPGKEKQPSNTKTFRQ